MSVRESPLCDVVDCNLPKACACPLCLADRCTVHRGHTIVSLSLSLIRLSGFGDPVQPIGSGHLRPCSVCMTALTELLDNGRQIQWSGDPVAALQAALAEAAAAPKPQEPKR